MSVSRPDSVSHREVQREVKVHGERWRTMYRGYFSSLESARPLLEAVSGVIERVRPDVIVDLGGGTGFVIKALADYADMNTVRRWVDLDLSEQQLAQVNDARIVTRRGSMMEFQREALASASDSVLYLTRSTFHYVGAAGQRKLLEHIRSQMKPGEYFIPQVAAFADEQDALCLSELFDRMGTGKWLTPLEPLKRLVCETGYALEAVRPAPPLVMESEEMSYRYDLSQEKMQALMRDLLRRYDRPRFLAETSGGFTATLDYYILCCRAV